MRSLADTGRPDRRMVTTGTPLPEAGTVAALVVDNAPASPNFGDLYFSYVLQLVGNQPVQPGIHRLDPVTGEIELDDLADPQVDDILDDLSELVLAHGGQVVIVPSDWTFRSRQ